MAHLTLDARRLLCPMPVIKTQEAVSTLDEGTLLTVICTDPGALHDIPAWCRIHGHQLMNSKKVAAEFGHEYLITLCIKGVPSCQ